MSKRIALIGGETPLGREVRECLNRDTKGLTTRSVGGKPVAADVTGEDDDEPAEATPIDRAQILASDIVVCVADPAVAQRARGLAGESGPPFVDLTYGLESLPESRLRSPLNAGTSFDPAETSVHVIANPAASALALLLSRIQSRFALRLAVAQIFEPASERGQAGLTELQKQVMSLLSFRPMEKRIFDAQLGFNMLGRYGEDAPESLADIEGRIERHLASLLAGTALLPSLRLVQAPVFHGHSISLWVEFAERPEMEDLEAELNEGELEFRGPDVEPPTNAGATGQSGVTVGLVEADRNNPRGVWMWAVADNYRIMADNTSLVVKRILGGDA